MKTLFLFFSLITFAGLTASETLATTNAGMQVKERPGRKAPKSKAARNQAEKTVLELIKPYDNTETPGGVILVMRDGRVIYKKSFGMANLSHHIPFETTTVTNIGSTSKQFTGFAIALLEQRGMLSLDDDIRKHIPELPEFEHTVTLRHLLSHTSGYREYINSLMMTGRKFGDVMEREEIIPLVQRQPKLQNIPGERFMYNNTGFALLSMVVERITDMPFDIWMKDNVFVPLGMNHTQIRTNPGQVIAKSAQGYVPVEEGGFTEMADIGASTGAGGIYTTVDDLAKWITNFFDPAIGGPDIVEKMQTPFLLNNGETTGYGLGLMIDEFHGLKRIQHGGADAAHRSALMIFPDIRGAVITQSNHAGFAGQIAQKVAEAFYDDLIDIENQDVAPAEDAEFVFDANIFDDYAGRYALEVAPDFILEFSREGDKLYTQASRQPKFEIFASSDTTFYLKVVEASVTFHRNAAGIVDAITLHQNGNNRANRIFEPAWAPTEEDLRQYEGRYFSEELETFYTVAVTEENKLIIQHRRLDDIPLTAEKQDEYTGTLPMASLSFVRNEHGQVTGFLASSGRSFDILFEKK